MGPWQEHLDSVNGKSHLPEDVQRALAEYDMRLAIDGLEIHPVNAWTEHASTRVHLVGRFT